MRSQNEIQERLRRKKFDQAVIAKTICFLKEKKLLDDEAFARIWIESGLNRHMGFARLKRELLAKGIEVKIIDNTIAQLKDNYSEETVVLEIAKARLSKLSQENSLKAKKSVSGYLLRRGFSPEAVFDVLEGL